MERAAVDVQRTVELLSPGDGSATRYLYFRYGRLFVVLDRDLCVVGVAVRSDDRSPMTVARPIVRELYARGDSVVPHVGDYLQAARGVAAYQVVEEPSRRSGGGLVFRVRKVDLPLPSDAVVVRWRWVPGKDAGVASRVTCTPESALGSGASELEGPL